MKPKSTGRPQAAAHRALLRDIERDWVSQFRSEHRRALQLQTQLEAQARVQRDNKLASARTKASTDLEKVKGRNVRRRSRIRSAARTRISDAKQARRDERRFYRDYWRVERIQRRQAPGLRKPKQQSRSEIDSLTEHNIEPELVPFWRSVRGRYSYGWTPDRRAEAFAEDLEDALQDELGAFRIQQELAQDWAASEAAHYAAQLSEVPF